MSKLTVGNFEHENQRIEKIKNVADKTIRIMIYLALLYVIIHEKNILSGAGWILMIMSEIMNYVPDIQKMKYKSGKILTMGVWIAGIVVYLAFWR